MTSKSWTKIFEFTTKFPADSVEFCPVEPFLNYFICGTYFLLEDDAPPKNVQERIGSIMLLKVTETLETLQTVETNGVLDTKWCPKQIDGRILLGVVSAKGDVDLYFFENELLVFLTGVNLRTEEEGDYMTLSINWSPLDSNTLCVTDNKGHAAVLKLKNDKLEVLHKWKAHELEAWTIAFDMNDPNVLYTGGDDAKLKIWDTREDPTQKVVCSRHNTGVTVIQTDTNQETQILTGSFDENLKLWDTRQWRTPVAEVAASGGIWRLKRNKNFYLSANIYGGFQVFDFSDRPKVVGEYKEHESLAYGADWSFLEDSRVFGLDGLNYLVGTCSFYDKKLTVSIWDSKFVEDAD